MLVPWIDILKRTQCKNAAKPEKMHFRSPSFNFLDAISAYCPNFFLIFEKFPGYVNVLAKHKSSKICVK